METKQCKKCACIYPASDKKCPSCGNKRGKLRRNATTINKNTPLSTRLIEVYEPANNMILSYILPAILLGRLSIIWAFCKANRPKRQKATFIVYDRNGGHHTETVTVGSNRYYELLTHST